MTVKEAIDRVNAIKPNQYMDDVKITWLSALDHRIYNDLISTHENNPYFTEKIYEIDEETGEEVQILVNEKGQEYIELPQEDYEANLFAGSPYSELYVYYLMSKIDEANGDTAQYINSSILFNNAYADFAKAYNRKNMHL